MLEILIASKSRYLVVHLSGSFNSSGAQYFDQELAELPPEICYVVIDFSQVDFLSSAGIRSMLILNKTLTARQGFLTLCALNNDLQKIIDLSGVSRLFNIEENEAKACALAVHATARQGGKRSVCIGDRTLHLSADPKAKSALNLWGAFLNPTPIPEPGAESAFMAMSPEELGLSLGMGALNKLGAAGNAQPTPFMTCWHAAGRLLSHAEVAPESETMLLDEHRSTTEELHLLGAVSISGAPFGVIDITCDSSLNLDMILKDLDALLPEHEEDSPPVRMLAVLGDEVQLPSENGAAHKCSQTFFLLLVVKFPLQADALPFLSHLKWKHNDTGLLYGVGLQFREPIASDSPLVRDNLRVLCLPGNLERMIPAAPGARMKKAKVWAFTPRRIRSGEEKRLDIEGAEEACPAQGVSHDECTALLRRLYARDVTGKGVSKINLTPLRNMDNTTYLVDLMSAQGEWLPTGAVKIGRRQALERELHVFNGSVKNTLTENKTMLKSLATRDANAALRFEFPEAVTKTHGLRPLSNMVRELPTENLVHIFNTIFTRILKPWLGRPKWEKIHPFAQHDPRLKFPSLLEDALHKLPIKHGAPTINCRELNRELLNPFVFLEKEFPLHEHEVQQWYTAYTFNPLCLKNILIDDRENIFLVDFARVQPKNILTDIAAIEIDLLINATRLDAEDDLKNLLWFLQFWYGKLSYDSVQDFAYAGADPQMGKIYDLLILVREYVNTVTLFETDFTPYLLALFEAALPQAVNNPDEQRRTLATAISGMLCEALVVK